MTTEATIEALMFELRDGLGALAEEGTRGRLAGCDRTAVKQVARRLRAGHRFDAKWNEADVATLILEWESLTGRR